MKFIRDTASYRIFETHHTDGKKFIQYLPLTHMKTEPDTFVPGRGIMHGTSRSDRDMGVYMGVVNEERRAEDMPKSTREPCADRNCGCKKPTPRKKTTRRKATNRRATR